MCIVAGLDVYSVFLQAKADNDADKPAEEQT